jgi:hypothetical protein
VSSFLVLFIVILAMQEKFQREANSAAVCVCVNSDGSTKYDSPWVENH